MGRYAIGLASLLALAGCAHFAPWSSAPAAARRLGADYPARLTQNQVVIGGGTGPLTTVASGTTTGQSFLYNSSGPPTWGYPAWATIVGAPSSLPPSGAAGGDLSGTYPNPGVAGLQGHALPTLPGSDMVLHYSGTAFSWATLPSGGAPSGAAGGDLSGTYPNPGVGGLLSHAIPSLPGSDMYLHYTGTSLAWSALPTSLSPSGAAGGDLSLTYPNPHVAGLLGSALPALPGSSQYLEYVPGTGFVWNTPSGGGGGGVTSLTAGTGISVNASTGAVTVTNTAPMLSNSVTNGLTGFTSCAAGGIVQGAGASPLGCTVLTNHALVVSGGSGAVTSTGPGVSGNPLVSNGIGGSPTFQTLGVSGGGSGVTSFTPSSIVVGNGTSPLQSFSPFVGAGVGGIVVSTGATGIGWTLLQRPSAVYDSGAASYTTPTGAPTAFTALTSRSITVPASGTGVAVHADYQWDMPPIACGSFCLPCGELLVYGIGIDSTSSALVTSLSTPQTLFIGSPIDSNGSNALNYSTTALTAGAHTVYTLVKVQNGNCPINVSSDAVVEVLP